MSLSSMKSNKYKPDFDFKKIKINDVGRYSITRPYEAKQIINIIQKSLSDFGMVSQNLVITDGTSGVGGDTIHFSKYFKTVNAIDILKENAELLKSNCETFSITNVNIFKADYTKIANIVNQDVLYLDPPWGGIGYKEKEKVDLKMSDIPIYKILEEITTNPFVFLKLPLNADMSRLNVKNKVKILNKKNIPSFYLVELGGKNKYQPYIKLWNIGCPLNLC